MSNSSTLNQHVPSLVLDYFKPDESVQLVQAYKRGSGWHAVQPLEASWLALFELGAQGFSSFGFRVGNSVADFSYVELEAYARRGMFARSAYPNREYVL